MLDHVWEISWNVFGMEYNILYLNIQKITGYKNKKQYDIMGLFKPIKVGIPDIYQNFTDQYWSVIIFPDLGSWAILCSHGQNACASCHSQNAETKQNGKSPIWIKPYTPVILEFFTSTMDPSWDIVLTRIESKVPRFVVIHGGKQTQLSGVSKDGIFWTPGRKKGFSGYQNIYSLTK